MNEHDVNYFRHLLQDKTNQIEQLCLRWQKIAKSSEYLPEEIEGEIRLTVGKAQLLTDQRFRQFSGLIDNCEFELGEKKTTCDDLQGFWDMIYIQIEDVEKKFDQLQQLQNNNWEINSYKVIQSRTKNKTKQMQINPVIKPKINNASIKNHILAARRNLAEAKARMTNGVSHNESGSVKVFEAPGFFVVSSPIRKPKESVRQNGETPTTPLSHQPVVRNKTPLLKNYIPLAVVTRSAKRALLAKEAMLKNA